MKYTKGDLLNLRYAYDSATPPIWIVAGHITNQEGTYYCLRSLCSNGVSYLRIDYVEETFDKVSK